LRARFDGHSREKITAAHTEYCDLPREPGRANRAFEAEWSWKMSLIGRLVDKLLKKGSITLKLPGKEPRTYGKPGGKHLTVRFTDRKVAFDIVKNPRLGVGETYMDGRLIIEDGTILDLLRMIVGANPWEEGGEGRRSYARGKLSMIGRLIKSNNLKRARRNVAHHYDLRDELYDLFLDADKQYSCAYWTDPERETLEQAQADKKAHIAAKLALNPGQRVLDIGCGWGGMALYLHEVAGVDVLGVTLSEHQLKIARERAAAAGVSDHVKFELRDYRLLDDKFDRIVSVGMFEHVGAHHYDEFFAKCRELLTPDGVMLLHTIGKLGEPSVSSDPFTDKWIFPGYHLPALSEMTASSEKVRLIASDVEMLRVHYAYTLLHWLERATAARAKIEAMYDERFFRMWEFYLAGGIVMFENGAACNYQVQYLRDRNALPITRDYMIEAERRYRELGAKPAPTARKPRSAGRRKTLEAADA
jgi:cyclopropane-fatty-acyl-phospholipid synthase